MKKRKVYLPERNYEYITYRELKDGGRTLKVVRHVIARHVNDDSNNLAMISQSTLERNLKGTAGEEVKGYTYYTYQGPSPYPPPLSSSSSSTKVYIIIEAQHNSFLPDCLIVNIRQEIH